MLVSEFEFNLPRELIADRPANPRDSSRLLDVGDDFRNCSISDLPDLLNSNDVLVFNDTKVIAARLFGKRNDTNVEVTLHKKLSGSQWLAFAKPAKKLKKGDLFKVSDDFSANVIQKDGGEVTLDFCVEGEEFYSQLAKFGKPPLPPYISRDKNAYKNDIDDYQTIYASNRGAVAAPTAGLHFTPSLFDRLEKKGVNKAFVTLHVGAGTFLPMKVDNTQDHKMHSEYCILTQNSADIVNKAVKSGGRVVAVGTTSLRLLESFADNGGLLMAREGYTDIFITPGYKFKVVDVLLTNFHLPKSTLFMLVSAFAGFEKMKVVYSYAIKNKLRFYSYGDACLLYKEK